MALLLSQTYEQWGEEALELGETNESGFDWEDSAHTVREAVARIKGREPSQFPITDPARCWFTDSDTCFITGDEEITAVHFSHSNKPHSLRYWIAAIRAAGFKVHS